MPRGARLECRWCNLQLRKSLRLDELKPLEEIVDESLTYSQSSTKMTHCTTNAAIAARVGIQ